MGNCHPRTPPTRPASSPHHPSPLHPPLPVPQSNGHFAASLDPLNLDQRPAVPELDPAFFGFTESDLDKPFFIGGADVGFLAHGGETTMTLRALLARLKETYCQRIGFEYMHIPERDRIAWLRQKIETPDAVRGPRGSAAGQSCDCCYSKRCLRFSSCTRAQDCG